MNNPNQTHLVIGGPLNGERVNWNTEISDGPEYHKYRLGSLTINDVSTSVYIFKTLTDEQALKMLQEDYLGI